MKKLTTEIFIQKAKQIHGDKYDYSKTEYIDAHTKIIIICPKHGEFYQTPNSHLNSNGCSKCYGNKQLTTNIFIQKAKQVHGDKYDYSKVNYKNTNTKVCIICPEHSNFLQTPVQHINRQNGCPKCAKKLQKQCCSFSSEWFIKKATLIHGDKYDYSKIEYINTHTKIRIICPEHGEFWQQPNNHLNHKGCLKCQSSKGEEQIELWLKENNIQFKTQKQFKDCKNIRLLSFDFYLLDYNILIEFDGEQHFKPKKFFGGKQGFQRTQLCDQIKNQYCQDNNIKLLRIPYIKFKNINQILNDYIVTNV